MFKVNTEDVFKRAKKMVEDLTEEVQTLNIQREEVLIIIKGVLLCPPPFVLVCVASHR